MNKTKNQKIEWLKKQIEFMQVFHPILSATEEQIETYTKTLLDFILELEKCQKQK